MEVRKKVHEVKFKQLPTGVNLEYVEQGDPSGTPVLLLPGGYDSWRAYESVLPHLPESVRVFAISQRGHGDSSKPDTGYLFQHYADDAIAFLDAHNIDAAYFVGHSLSTMVAQRIAIDAPDRVRGIFLIGAGYSVANNPAMPEIRDNIIMKLEDPIDPDLVREFQEKAFGQPLKDEQVDSLINEPLKIPAHIWKAVFEGMIKDDHSDSLHKIKAPVLLIWGDQDKMCDRSEQDSLKAAIPGAQLIIYEGLGHSPHWQVPDRLAIDLVNFVRNTG